MTPTGKDIPTNKKTAIGLLFNIFFPIELSSSGTGLRSLMDTYVYTKNVSLAFDYISEEMESLDLRLLSSQIASFLKNFLKEET